MRFEKRPGRSAGSSPLSTISTPMAARISRSARRMLPAPTGGGSGPSGSCRRRAAVRCITGRERIPGAAMAAWWRQSATSTVTRRAKSRWLRRQRRTRRVRSRASSTSIRVPRARSSGTGREVPERCSDAWSSTPAISTETGSTISPSARRISAVTPATRSAGSNSAPAVAERYSPNCSATRLTAGSDGTFAAHPIPTD